MKIRLAATAALAVLLAACTSASAQDGPPEQVVQVDSGTVVAVCVDQTAFRVDGDVARAEGWDQFCAVGR